VKHSIQLGTQLFDYTDPFSHTPKLRDAVHAISNICRFGGHTRFYSVAQHCVLVSVLAKYRPWDGLAHDLAEAYYGDFPTPLKALIRDTCPLLAARLRTIDTLVEEAFLFDPHQDEVKKADTLALAMERRDLLPRCDAADGPDGAWAFLPKDLPEYIIRPLSPEEAEKAWWARYESLTKKPTLAQLGVKN
jgi:hypothetical protein